MSPSDLLQEIDADLQRQKMEALWKRYGTYVLAGALLIVLATAGVSSWRTYTVQKHQEQTTAILQILNDKKLDNEKQAAALNTFAAAYPKATQATLSRLQIAALELKDNKVAEAMTQYDAIAADEHADPLFRQLANLLAVQAQMDNGDPAALQARLEPLLVDSAWRFSAKEFSANLALRSGDKVKARQLFSELTQSDPEMPPSIMQRAKYMLTWLGEGS